MFHVKGNLGCVCVFVCMCVYTYSPPTPPNVLTASCMAKNNILVLDCMGLIW